MNTHIRFLGLGILLLSGCAAVQQANPPAISEDGLNRVKSKSLDLVYVRSRTDFAAYDSLYAEELVVEFDKNWLRQNSSGDPINVTDRDQKRIVDNLRTLFAAELTETMAADMGYELVDSPGPNTLVMRPALVDVRITFPDTFEPYSITVLGQDAGSMRVQLELLDAGSNQALLRMEDKRSGRTFGASSVQGTLRRQSIVENRQEAINMLQRWARSLNAAMLNNPA